VKERYLEWKAECGSTPKYIPVRELNNESHTSPPMDQTREKRTNINAPNITQDTYYRYVRKTIWIEKWMLETHLK
jgi:hypothetical protein